MIKKILFLSLTFSFLIGMDFAQEDAENKPGWTGDVGLFLSFTRGNSETTNVNLTFSAKRNFDDRIEWENSGFFLLSRIEGVTSAESMGLASRLIWSHKDRLFSYCEIRTLRDRFKNYDSRFIPGAGIGYKAVMTEGTELSLNAGVSVVITRYHDVGETDSYLGLDLGDQFTWKISSTAEFSQVLTWNADIADLDHFFVRLELNLAAAVSKKLAVKLSLIDSYDNDPVGTGIKKNDLAFLSGLSLKF